MDSRERPAPVQRLTDSHGGQRPLRMTNSVTRSTTEPERTTYPAPVDLGLEDLRGPRFERGARRTARIRRLGGRNIPIQIGRGRRQSPRPTDRPGLPNFRELSGALQPTAQTTRSIPPRAAG